MGDSNVREEDISKSYQILVLKTTERFIEAHAAQERWRYFSFFRSDLELLMRHLDLEDQQALEQDFQTLKKMLKEIALSKDYNAEEKKRRTTELQENFADEHRFYIYKAFPKAGIQKPEQEGTMDYSKHDIDQLKQIIRAGKGVGEAALKEAAETAAKK